MQGPRACALVLAACVTYAASAHAAPDDGTTPRDSSDTTAAAETLFEHGKALMAEKKFAEACAEFAESQRLDAGVGTMLYLADCYESNGQTASAWGVFREAESTANREGDTHRGQIAHDRAAALEPKLVKLVVVVAASPPPGLEVRRDGILLGAPLFGTAVPVDPGDHELRAIAPGFISWSGKIHVGDAPTSTITIPSLVPAPVSAPPPSDHPTPSHHGVGNTQRALGLLAGGVGLAGIGVGVVFGVVAKTKVDASNADGHCTPGSDGTDRCDGAGLIDRDDARQASTISTIFVLSGAGLVTAGVALYLLAPSDHSTSVAIAPLVGPTNGFALHARW